MYRNGEGTHPQPSEAAAWYWKAAYQGFSSAQYELGMMCAVGRGIPKNYANAYMWLSLASTSSEDEAAKQRDVIAKEMPAAEITEVQQLVKSWQPAFPVGHGVSAPVIISHVDPEYPEEARRAKISGTVFLQVIIDATGRVRDILVMRGPGHGLEAKAIQAVGQWRFRPGSRNGQPSTTQVPVEVNFNLVTDKR
jgi:TonB family protein